MATILAEGPIADLRRLEKPTGPTAVGPGITPAFVVQILLAAILFAFACSFTIH
jgi:hypothetical protein